MNLEVLVVACQQNNLRNVNIQTTSEGQVLLELKHKILLLYTIQYLLVSPTFSEAITLQTAPH